MRAPHGPFNLPFSNHHPPCTLPNHNDGWGFGLGLNSHLKFLMTSSSNSHLLLFINLAVALATVVTLVDRAALGVGSSKLLSFRKARVLHKRGQVGQADSQK